MDTIINDSTLLDGGSKLLSKKQAVAELGVSYRTLDRLWHLCRIVEFRGESLR